MIVRMKGRGCAGSVVSKIKASFCGLGVTLTGVRRCGGVVLVSGAYSLHTMLPGQAQPCDAGLQGAVLCCKFCCALPACTAMLQRN